MLGGLLVIDLLALALAAYSIRGQREYLRESVLIGFVLWASAVLASTEGLSIFHAIGFWEILIFWILVLVFCEFLFSSKGQAFLSKSFSILPKAYITRAISGLGLF